MDRWIEGTKEKKVGWSTKSSQRDQNIIQRAQKSTSGSSKLVQNDLLGDQMSTQGVVLATHGAQGRPLSPSGGAPGGQKVDLGSPKGGQRVQKVTRTRSKVEKVRVADRREEKKRPK